MIRRIIRLPLKLIAMPAALALFLCHAACAILIGIGYMVTNLVSGLFIFGAAIEWIAGAPSAMAYQCLGLGLFLLAAPHLAGWIIGKAADLLAVQAAGVHHSLIYHPALSPSLAPSRFFGGGFLILAF